MALTATQQRGVRANKTVGENGIETMTAEVPYLVAGVTALDVDSAIILAATGLPAIGSAGHGGVCIGFSVEQPTEAVATSAWKVVARYGAWPAGTSGDPSEHDPNPVNRSPIITRRVVERSEVLFQDFSEPPKAIVNTLGQPFDPGIEESKHRLSLSVQRYIGTVASLGNRIREYAGRVNLAAEGPFEARTLLCRDIQETTTFEGTNPETGLPYKVVNQVITLEADPDEWVVEVLNRGTKHLEKIDITGDYKAVTVMDDNGVATGEIVLLDDQSNIITWQEIANGMQPHFIPFVTRKTAPFGVLNLPNLWGN